MNLNCVQPKKQVLPEAASFSLRIYVCVCCSDDTRTNASSMRRADSLHFSRLQHAKQLCLQIQRNVCDLVKKERAAIGKFKTADAVSPRVSESALHMAEQLAFENTLGEASRINRHHGLIGARR